MNVKNFFKSLTKYTPQEKYEFNLSENSNTNTNSSFVESDKKENKFDNIFPSLNVNLEYIRTKYNVLINSDIVLREFTLNARGKQYNAFIIYIEGMVNNQLMDNFILEPLMMRNRNNLYDSSQNKVISEAVTNNITVRKVKKFDLSTYVLSCLMPQNSVKKVSAFSKIISGINSGNCGLFIDTLDVAFDIELKGFNQRSIDKPANEIVVKGPHEAFVENIRTNTSMIRRIVNNENLIIENIEIGKVTKTKCALFYISNITNNDLISEVKYRLNNLDIDSLMSSRSIRTINF